MENYTFVDGVLTLYGNEVETDYTSSERPVWESEIDGFSYLLTTVVFECNVTKIGAYAFYGCYSLYSITIPDGVESIGENAFCECSSIYEITIPGSVKSIGAYAFYGCNYMHSITIPDGVEDIGKWAFHECDALTSITIPGSVKSIKEGAFYGCDVLSSITVQQGVESIGQYVFYGCGIYARTPTQITIPEGINKIEDSVFYSCGVEEIIIPSSVTSIARYAFGACVSLKKITIPGGITSIGEGAFVYCESLEKIYILCSDAEIYDSEETIYSTTVIHGYAGSTAQSYAEKYSRAFVLIEEKITGIEITSLPSKINYIVGEDFDCTGLVVSAIQSDGTQTVLSESDYIVSGFDSTTAGEKTIIVYYQEYAATFNVLVINDTCTVKFINWDGSVIKEEAVDLNCDATPPDDPVREGYRFAGWDKPYTNVASDMEITAQYIKVYTVTFYGFDGSFLNTEQVDEGTPATAPTPPAVTGYAFIRWNRDFSDVTEDIDVNAVYDYAAVITITPDEIIMYEGKTADININVGPEGIADKNISVSVYPDDVITLDSGVITALQPREATITVTHNVQGVTSSAHVKVLKEQETPDDYKNAIASGERGLWDAEVSVNGEVVPKEYIEKIELNEKEFQTDKIGVGAVTSSYVDISFRNKGLSFTNKKIRFKIGMKVNGEFQYTQFQTFYATDVSGYEDDEVIKVTAYDSMKKTSRKYKTKLEYPADVITVAEEICSLCGLKLHKGRVYTDIIFERAIKAKTCRSALKVIAQLLGANVVINRNDELEFRFLKETDITIDADNRYYYFRKSDVDTCIYSVKISNKKETFSSVDDIPVGGENLIELAFTNKFGNQHIADMILQSASVVYRSGELSFLGDPSICVGDIITVKDKNGKTYKYPIMENIITFDGGVKNDTKAYAESEEAQEFQTQTTDEKIEEVSDDVDDVYDTVYGEQDPDTGIRSGGLVDSMLKVVSCIELPENPDAKTIYLIQGEVTVN